MSFCACLVYNLRNRHRRQLTTGILARNKESNEKNIFIGKCIFSDRVCDNTNVSGSNRSWRGSKYNAFIQNDFTVTGSDTQGRIAVGGDFVVGGGNDVGYKNSIIWHGIRAKLDCWWQRYQKMAVVALMFMKLVHTNLLMRVS